MKSILLVDDDDDDRALFKEAVQQLDENVQCWTASDGLQALSVLSYDLIISPEVIFLDLNMPKMNGLEFLSTIKRNRQFSSIPVIIYTTSSNPDDFAKCKKLGAIDFLTKPSDFQELTNKLTHILRKHLIPLMPN